MPMIQSLHDDESDPWAQPIRTERRLYCIGAQGGTDAPSGFRDRVAGTFQFRVSDMWHQNQRTLCKGIMHNLLQKHLMQMPHYLDKCA